eukprot:gene24017-9592_t
MNQPGMTHAWTVRMSVMSRHHPVYKTHPYNLGPLDEKKQTKEVFVSPKAKPADVTTRKHKAAFDRWGHASPGCDLLLDAGEHRMAHIQAAAIYGEAVQLHEAERTEEAEVLYRRVLHIQPDNGDAKHCLGLLLMELYEGKKYTESRELLESAIATVPSNAKFHQSLGVLHESCGKYIEAILMSLGHALKEAGRQGRAADVYRSVTKLVPGHPTAYYKKATCLKFLGRKRDALAAYRKHLRLFPKDMQTRFWICALKGDSKSMQAMPPELVAGLFDKYANKFEDHLVHHLDYKIPKVIADLLLEYVHLDKGPKQTLSFLRSLPYRRAVDLGCGTGLMGPSLHNLLQVQDLVTYLRDGPPDYLLTQSTEEVYDLFVAADVFVYIGNLQPILKYALAKASKWAFFIFTVESLEALEKSGENGDEDIHTTSRRYAHSSEYIHRLASDTGWEVVLMSDLVIRKNGGKPVHGYLFSLLPQGSPFIPQLADKHGTATPGTTWPASPIGSSRAPRS